METVINAAREYLDERLARVRENYFGDYTAEDLASVLREIEQMEAEIAAYLASK